MIILEIFYLQVLIKFVFTSHSVREKYDNMIIEKKEIHKNIKFHIRVYKNFDINFFFLSLCFLCLFEIFLLKSFAESS